MALKLDGQCLSCTGNKAIIQNAFKMACLAY